MNRFLCRWAVSTAIALSAAPAIQAAQGDAPVVDPQGIARLQASGAEVSVRGATGAAQFVRLAEGKGAVNLAPQSARGASAAEQAKAFLAQNGGVFGIDNVEGQLLMRGERTDLLGFKHVTFQQVHNGVPVFGAELQGHVDGEGRLVAVNGTSVPGISVDTTPRRSQVEAGQTALALVAAGRDAASVKGLSVKDSRLVVYRTGLIQGVAGTDHLTYEVEVTNGGNVREFVFVDAHTGKMVDQITGVYDALNRRAFDGQGNPNPVPPNYPNNPFWVEGDPFPTGTVEADNMIRSSKEVYDMYKGAFGYESFDGHGAQMDAIFNRGNACPNASWNGTFISFCPGFTTDDVTAHEWSHAYTEYTDNLIYAWQSGALNEAYSDIFGETIDLTNGLGLDSPNTPRTPGNCTAFTPPQGQFQINSPGSIARTSPAQSAAFGPALNGTGITGSVVVGLDAANPSGPSTTDGCTAFTNAAAVAGNIALVDRGTCIFTVKVKNAQLAGAVAVIIAANAATGLPGMGGADATITISSLGILQADGDAIKTALASSTVDATLRTTAGSTDNSYRWLMGEEVTPLGALRDMFSPNCYANPAKVSDLAYYACGTADGGGVHTNSGVINKMYSLLVDGGLFNSQNVQALGLTKTAHIYFRAKFYQVASTDFPAHASAIEQSCADLRGQNLNSLTTGLPSGEFITQNDCAQVAKAIAAVELRTPPTQCNFQPQLQKNPPANVCGVGPANLLFSENVEGSISAWTRTNAGVFPSFTPRDWAKTSVLPGGRSGSAFFALDDPNLGDCAANDESGALYLDSPSITLPATPGFPRVSFDHYVATEGGWDGGNIKVSVNGGAWQNTVFTQFTYNPYLFLLNTAAQGNTNPLAGQQAFTGADGGSNIGSWGRSIVDLTGMALPGDSVRLRFAFGNDGCGGNDGWYVDDVNVYQCTAGGAATLSVNDVSRTEGNNGSANATFTISLSEASAETVTVRVNTADGTATAGSDYTALSNVLVTFAPGVTSRTFNVPVLGDAAIEPNETFFVNLGTPTNAAIADGQGIGTIIDDDSPPPVVPAISINDATVTEGNAGSSNATFTVSLDQATTVPVTVQVGTADGTATAGSDYTAVAAATLTFLAGETTKTVEVAVSGDRIPEADETFFVNLSNPTGATIADNQGLGTITNDDVVVGDFDGDLKSDLVLRDTASTGRTAIWHMNDGVRTSAELVNPGPVPLSWEIQGVGDFNGDGKPDLVWRDQGATGAAGVWFMDGATQTGAALFTPGPALGLTWRIVGVGDFNGDGKPDLVWRDQGATGMVAVWFMDGTTRIGTASLTPGVVPGLTWRIVGVGDFNGDGKPDLVWRDQGATGTVGVWFMDGATRTGAAVVTPALFPGPNWQIQAVADYNGDGQPDLVWRDQGTSGAVVIWHMAGVTKSSVVLVTPPPMPGLNWRIVGPR